MALLRVGENRRFTTIKSAYEYANNGDILFIDEGEYFESLYIRNKIVNLVANTAFSDASAVTIYTNYSLDDYAMFIAYSKINPLITMYIEGITLVGDNNKAMVCFYSSVSQLKNLNVVFNKCIIDATNGVQDGVFSANDANAVKSVSFINSKILWQNDSFDNDKFNSIQSVSIQNSILNNVAPSWIVTRDYVIDNEHVGYGPRYGQYITYNLLPEQYSISGTVTVNSINAERELRFFDHSNDTYLGYTISSSSTGEYYKKFVLNTSCYIICMDDTPLPNYNDLIKSKCSPKLMQNITYETTEKNYLTVNNPGAETGDLSGWTVETGSFSAYNSSTYNYTGAYNFLAGPYVTSILSQRLDLLSNNVNILDIDNELLTISVESVIRNYQQTPGDDAYVGLRLLDSSENVIGVDTYSGPFYFTEHEYTIHTKIVVSGTRYVDILLKGYRNNGTSCDAHFDDIKVYTEYL